MPPPRGQFPPPMPGQMRGAYRGPPGGPPGPLMRMGPPRMRPDQRWMNRGPPPRFPIDMPPRSQSGPMFPQRPNNPGRLQGPPVSAAARFPPPPSAGKNSKPIIFEGF